MRPIADGSPVKAFAVRADHLGVVSGAIEESNGCRSLLRCAVDAHHPHALLAGRFEKVNKVGRFGRPTGPAIATWERVGLVLAHFTTEPAVMIAPTAARHPNDGEAGSRRAGAESGVAQARRAEPGGQIGSQDAGINGDRGTIGIEANAIGAGGRCSGRGDWRPADQLNIVNRKGRLDSAGAILPVEPSKGCRATQSREGNVDLSPTAGGGIDIDGGTITATVTLLNVKAQLPRPAGAAMNPKGDGAVLSGVNRRRRAER